MKTKNTMKNFDMVLLVVHETKKEGKMAGYKCVNRRESERLTYIYQRTAEVPGIGSKIGSEKLLAKKSNNKYLYLITKTE